MVPEIPELVIFGNLVYGPYPLEWNLNGGWAYGVDRNVVPLCNFLHHPSTPCVFGAP